MHAIIKLLLTTVCNAPLFVPPGHIVLRWHRGTAINRANRLGSSRVNRLDVKWRARARCEHQRIKQNEWQSNQLVDLMSAPQRLRIVSERALPISTASQSDWLAMFFFQFKFPPPMLSTRVGLFTAAVLRSCWLLHFCSHTNSEPQLAQMTTKNEPHTQSHHSKQTDLARKCLFGR